MSSSSALMAPMLPAIRALARFLLRGVSAAVPQAAAARAVPGAWLPLAIRTDTR